MEARCGKETIPQKTCNISLKLFKKMTEIFLSRRAIIRRWKEIVSKDLGFTEVF